MSPVAKKTKRKPTRRVESPPSPSLNMYRRIAVGFVVAVALMLGAVLYVSTVSATIRVTPASETMKTEFLADVVKTPTKETEVRGQVAVATVGKTQTFSPAGNGLKDVEEKSAGTVTIRNTSTRVQPLVATTRLLSPEGILFRLDAGVTVPAGGSVEAAVHADQPGASGDVAPTRFTIPGLSESLQKLIYAESASAFTGGVRQVAVIGQQDIDQSALLLRTALEEETKTALRQQVDDSFSGEAFSYEIVDQTSDVPAGTEASSFALTMSIKATGVFYDQEALKGVATRRLYAQLAPGTDFASLDADALQVRVDSADTASGTANLRAYLDGEAIHSSTSQSLDPARFVGMTADEVKNLLVGEGVATDVTVDFRPFWVSKVPQLQDHVYVEIEKASDKN